jgi:hypothetical protein
MMLWKHEQGNWHTGPTDSTAALAPPLTPLLALEQIHLKPGWRIDEPCQTSKSVLAQG